MTCSDATPDLRPHIRPGDTVVWGQAHAQPFTLILALLAQRREIGPLRVFLGIGHALEDVLTPEHADVIELFGYCAAGSNRQLVEAGAMDILPLHYSELARRMRERSLPVDVANMPSSPCFSPIKTSGHKN